MARLCNSTTFQIKNLPNILIIVRNSSEESIRKLLRIGGCGGREYLGVVIRGKSIIAGHLMVYTIFIPVLNKFHLLFLYTLIHTAPALMM